MGRADNACGSSEQPDALRERSNLTENWGVGALHAARQSRVRERLGGGRSEVVGKKKGLVIVLDHAEESDRDMIDQRTEPTVDTPGKCSVLRSGGSWGGGDDRRVG